MVLTCVLKRKSCSTAVVSVGVELLDSALYVEIESSTPFHIGRLPH